MKPPRKMQRIDTRRTTASHRTLWEVFSPGWPKDDETDRLMDEFECRKYPGFWAVKQEDKRALEIGRKHRAKVQKKTSPDEDRAIYEAVEKVLRGKKKKKLRKDAAFRHVVERFAKKGRSLSKTTVRRAWLRGRSLWG
jgi:hypothetical protein